MFIVRIIMQTVGLALGQIRANKFRAALTSLGIIIGVGSVTAVIAGLTGLRAFVLSEFETVGARYVYIDGTVPPSMANKVNWRQVQLTIPEVEALRDRAETIERITPWHWSNQEVRYGEELLVGVRVIGIWPSFHEVESRSVLRGREFTPIDEEERRYVCLINEKAIEELNLDRDPVGDSIFVGGRRFLIVGVVETKERSAMFGGGEPQTEVFVPFSVSMKLNPTLWVRHATAQLTSPEAAEDAKAEIAFVLRTLRGQNPEEENTFIVEVVQAYIDSFKKVSAGLTAVAAGVVSVSLLVGGVGIMNIMLVSVSERTREIGLRKAVGAKPSVILTQFLVEAVALCALGGLIGLVIGQGLAVALQQIPGARLEGAEVPTWAKILAIAFSAGVGVLFGMFPAIKAARLDPIEALRHE